MNIIDLRQQEGDLTIDTDLCIVGSGPAGLSIAGEFAGAGVKVLIVESGGLESEAESEALSEIDNVGAPRVMEQTKVRNRVFGGSSHTWGGRCASFDEIDYEARSWVPFSGWPFGRAALDPYMERAASLLGITPGYYGEQGLPAGERSIADFRFDAELMKPFFWQWSRDLAVPREAMRFGRSFLSVHAPNVSALLHATVTQITTNDYGSQLREVEVASLVGKRATIRPKALVLCGGGIENARMLLYSNRIMKPGVGNQHDQVGRYMMDHPRCIIGEFDLARAEEIRSRFSPVGRVGRYFSQGLALSAVYQEKMGLVNCAAWTLEEHASDDPWDAFKRIAKGESQNRLQDLSAIAFQPGFVARGAWERLSRGRGFHQKLKRLVLECDVAQTADPESRIGLSDRRDKLGLPLARINWRVSAQEKQTIATFANLIAQEFQRVGLPAPKLAEWIRSGRHDEIVSRDAAHPTGTTRMSSDPRQGVVDENGRLHGVEGIYVAGSSVFPTIGHANPTLTIVALSLRLANWLKRNVFAPSDAARVSGGAVKETSREFERP